MVYIEYRIGVVITSPINLTGLDFYQKPFICKGKLHFYDLSNIFFLLSSAVAIYFNQAPQKLQTNKSANTVKQQPVILKTP